MTINKQDLDQTAKASAPVSGQEISAPQRASRRRITNDGAANPADLMPAAASADEMAAKFSKRRRFIKVGASTVPVALTLTSQPVLAWHCNSTSAWGSGLMQNNTGSVKARNLATQRADECKSINDWKTNNSSPWCHANLKCSEVQPSKIDNTTVAKFDDCVGWQWNNNPYGKQTKTSGSLQGNFNKGKQLTCSQFGVNTTLCKGTTRVWDMLNSGTAFQQCIAAAMLNERCYADVAACLKTGKAQTSALAAMATGKYTPVSGVTWGQTEIIQYLKDNWIAV